MIKSLGISELTPFLLHIMTQFDNIKSYYKKLIKRRKIKVKISEIIPDLTVNFHFANSR